LRQSALEIAPLRVGRPDGGRTATGQVGTRRSNRRTILVLWRSTHGPTAVNDD